MRLLSIVTMPILTGVLNPTAYGVAALVGTVISLVSVFALAGIDMSYRRAYHSAQPPSGDVVEHYCWRFAIAAGMVSGVLGAVVWWYFIEMDLKLAILLAMGIIGSVANAMTLLAGALGRTVPCHSRNNNHFWRHRRVRQHRHRDLVAP